MKFKIKDVINRKFNLIKENLPDHKPGYHLRKIRFYGEYGSQEKLLEELDEFLEACEQDNRILSLVELSDIFGALKKFAENQGTTLEELEKMSEATERGFKSGSRK